MFCCFPVVKHGPKFSRAHTHMKFCTRTLSFAVTLEAHQHQDLLDVSHGIISDQPEITVHSSLHLTKLTRELLYCSPAGTYTDREGTECQECDSGYFSPKNGSINWLYTFARKNACARAHVHTRTLHTCTYAYMHTRTHSFSQ